MSFSKSKFRIAGLTAVAGSVLPALASATTTVPTADNFLTLEAADLTAIVSYVGTLTTDLMPIIALAAGIPLALFVIKKVIGMVKG